MAITKTIVIDIQTGDAQKDIDKLKKSVVDLGEEGSKAMDDVAESTENVGKAGKESKKGLSAVATGFKGIGTALKAAGIGLVIALFVSLKEVLGQNQQVIDFLAETMTTVTLAFNAVGTALKDAWTSVNELTGGFDALGKVMSGIGTLIFTPFKVSLNVIKGGITALQLAWEKSIFGSGDEGKIADLTASLKGTRDELIEISKEAIKAGGDIVDNFSEAVTEVGELGKAVAEEIGDINLKVLQEQAETIVALKKQAEIARAINAGLIEDYDRQAEQQRQIRDDVNKSITERQVANEKLNAILLEQERVMIANANATIAAAQAQLQVNNNQEQQIALIEAQNEKKAILAQIEGKRSEQLVNQTALINELNTLEQTAEEGAITRAIERRAAQADLIKNEEDRLNKLRENLEIDREIELSRLQTVIDATNEGTQARADAEQARLDSIQAFAIEEDALNFDIEEARRERALEQATIDAENEFLSFEIRREALAEQRQLILDDEALTDAQRVQLLQENSLAVQEIGEIEKNVRLQQMAAIGAGLGALSSILGESTAAGKALSVSQALINTYLGITEVWSGKGSTPFVTATLLEKIAATAVVAAQGFAAVKQITSVKVPGGGGGGGAVGSPRSIPAATVPSVTTTPQFNVVGTSGTNQLAESLAGQQNEPIKAYVVSTEVSSQQELDRNIIDSATF